MQVIQCIHCWLALKVLIVSNVVPQEETGHAVIDDPDICKALTLVHWLLLRRGRPPKLASGNPEMASGLGIMFFCHS